MTTQAVPKFSQPPGYPQGYLLDDQPVSVPAVEGQTKGVPPLDLKADIIHDHQIANNPVQLLAVLSQTSLLHDQPHDVVLHQLADLGPANDHGAPVSDTSVNIMQLLIKRSKELVKASKVLYLWKAFLAHQMFTLTLVGVALPYNVDGNRTSRCLNDTSRACFLNLAVASSLESACAFVSVSVFPAGPPGVYELLPVLKDYLILSGNTSSLVV